ncbi:DNA repair protein rad16 [Collariella sp. IMI 366227]|nr:DNA repair protein rad16 [Collariella sp. IMI 366227]
MVRTRRSAAADEIANEISDSSTAPTSVASFSGSGYTTPLTSITATPALSDSLQPPRGKRLNRIEVHLPSVRLPTNHARHQSVYSMGSKRKRNVVQDSEEEDFSDESPDATLARKLQVEEDAASAPLPEPSLGSGAALRRSLRSLAGPISTSDSNPNGKARRPARGANSSKKANKRLAITIADSEEDDESAAAEFSDESDDSALVLSARYRGPKPRNSTKIKALPTSSLGSHAQRGRRPAAAEPSKDDDNDEPEDYDSDASFAGPTAAGDLSSDAGSLFESEDNADGDAGEGADDVDVILDAVDQITEENLAVRAAARSRRAYRAYRGLNRIERDRLRLEKQHPELLTMWKDLENMPVLKAGKAEQPKSISRQLKPFQLEGLAWMTAMEKTKWKGGLLGDEMGLGKTIQAVSLIMSDFPAKNPSLVLVPPVALMQWMTEIASYTDGTLKTLVFHGTNSKSKNLTIKDIKKYDVIIMSYNSLESMFRKQEKGFKRKDGLFKEKSIIHQTNFHRVILDEAHSIKTRTTMTAKACFALKVTYRWCLSGTPLQNRIGEFFSLIRFLNISPFASYLCKQCPCSTPEWHMNEDSQCTHCGHSSMQHVSVFNQELLNPIQRYGNQGPGTEAFRKLRLLTDRIMLRRLKKDHMDSMELPVKEINVERQFFGEEENDFANSIMTNGQRKFDTYVASGVLLNNYANIFGLIMQMRQVADHPDLILKKNSEGGQNILVCNICDEPAEDAIRSRCKHDFCRTCVKSYLNSTSDPNCPQCHIPLSIDLEQVEMEQDEALVKKSSIINRIKMENWTSSSKIELLVHELHKLRSDNSSQKSIIFSQFTTMLQLIEWRLRRAGITTVMLDGSMTPAQRQASIEHFMNNVDVECFLVSLKAGGVALNLTEASQVFIVDPWWNPAALCIEDSVESRMVMLQEKKTNMINSTINSDDAAMESLSPEDLQFLFRGS